MKTQKFTQLTCDWNGKPYTVTVFGNEWKQGKGLPVHLINIDDSPRYESILEIEENVELFVFELGDRVTVDCDEGATQNDDGIVTGGAWVARTGTVVKVSEYVFHGMPTGDVLFDNGRTLSCSLVQGNRGYPRRNIQPAN